MSDILQKPVQDFVPAQARVLKRLQNLGIKTVRDLLYHFPRRYEDYSTVHPIAALHKGQTVTVQGALTKIDGRHAWGRRGMTIIEATIEDATGSITALWFNQHYLLKTFKPGQRVSLSGKVALGKQGLYLQHPEHEIMDSPSPEGKKLRHTGRLVPIYPETHGMTSRWLRFLIQTALEKLPKNIPDVIPADIRKNENLMSLDNSLFAVHFPQNEKEAETAERRFRFEELFLLQLKKFLAVLELREKQAPAISIKNSYTKELLRKIPFELTGAQRRAIDSVLEDLQKPYPMNRLLNGDVGSGKTIIALLGALSAINDGHQVAFMAPTEILARQHFQTFEKFFSDLDIAVALATSSEKKLRSPFGNSDKADIEKLCKDGTLQLVIGTHALIQGGMKFKNLGLVIVDEQHRFGVEQRAKLLSGNPKGIIPHFLSMTATPIPRTLALTVYGDLDISVIDELPPGRKKIITKIVAPKRRAAAYQFVEEEVKKGRQVFVICPRIEESEEQDAGLLSQKTLQQEEMKNVKKEFKKLSEAIFPKRSVAMLHGKMRPKEKEKIMKDFKDGTTDMLVSTSVIEVGVDVPNATIMMIESAERFGLASLHQFRGRVGRGEHQSYCLLFPTSETNEWNARLKAVAVSENGFQLAEADLKLRGPGNLVGFEQSGFHTPLQQALADAPLVEQTAKAAKKIITDDPELKKYPLLAERLQTVAYTLHAE